MNTRLSADPYTPKAGCPQRTSSQLIAAVRDEFNVGMQLDALKSKVDSTPSTSLSPSTGLQRAADPIPNHQRRRNSGAKSVSMRDVRQRNSEVLLQKKGDDASGPWAQPMDFLRMEASYLK